MTESLVPVLRNRQALQTRYELLWERTPDMMLWLDADYRIVEANAAVGRGFHVEPAHLLGRIVTDLCAPESVQSLLATLTIARTGGRAAVKTTQRFEDGESFFADVAISSIDTDGTLAILVVLRNISERGCGDESGALVLEKAPDSSRVEAHFVAKMSHEIRSPMNAVIGMNELLLETVLTVEQREYAEAVKDSSSALLGIIDEILDFSKIEAKGLSLELLDIDVHQTLEAAVSVLAISAQRKGISLTTYIDPHVPRFVVGDQLRIRQIIINLVANAVKFTEEGGVVVTVSRSGTNRTSSRLRFAVKDSGIGFDSDAAQIIFEPFRQAERSTSRTHGGTGLGLSISRELVELMGGKLTVESTPNVGTEFSFDLDFARSKTPMPIAIAPLSGLRAIIVHSDALAGDVLARYMRDWGMATTSASSGEQAMFELQDAGTRGVPYAVAIIDNVLSDMSGMELAQRIKVDPAISATRMIKVTNYDSTACAEAATAAGFRFTLLKPVVRAQLLNCISQAIRGRDPGEEVPLIDPGRAYRHLGNRDAPARAEQILVVEDLTVNQKLVVQQLKKLGFAAHAVSDGQKAVTALRQERYDLILMDCQMPVMNGFEATRAIRTMELHSGGRIPIVAMTANARLQDREDCLAAGMDDYLAKPIMLDRLRTTIASWLPEQAALRSAPLQGASNGEIAQLSMRDQGFSG